MRTSSALYINNYITDTLGHKHPYPLDSAFFGNVIVYGNQDEEITFDSVSSVAFNHTFDHCLLKTGMKTNNPNYFISCLGNLDPGYVNPAAFNYQLDSISPAIQKGVPLGVDYDIKGVFRGSTPDLGAYQYVPK